jgi:nicotinate-nucleotide pyrophosphorylase (carboxylating)
MLDNMSFAKLKKSIQIIRKFPQVLIEVSGGVTLKNVRKIARLGVDRISVGAITHSAPALDVRLEVEGPAKV